MKTKSIIVLFCTLNLLINACNMPGVTPVARPTAQANPAVIINMIVPQTGSIYSVGNIVSFSAYLFVSGAGLQINEHTFLVNGTSVGANNYESSYLYGNWTASNPGEYYIQAKATLSDGSTAISEPTRICVVSLPSAIPNWSGYLGPCNLPTRIPNPASTGNVVINAVVLPSVIPFSRICGVPNPSVTIIANVDDPQDLVALVSVNILKSASLTWPSYLNWIVTRPVNQKEYRATIQFQPYFLDGVETLHWYVYAYGRDGRQLQMTQDVIIVQPIECSQQHLETSPSATPAPLQIIPSDTPIPTLAAPPTFTLNKNAFCRRGPNMSFSTLTSFTAGETGDILNISEDGIWYFVYWKKSDAKCWVATRTGDVSGDLTGLKVLVAPTMSALEPGKPTVPPEPEATLPPEPTLSVPEPALPPSGGCSSYGDASSCTTNGCSWDKPTNSCH